MSGLESAPGFAQPVFAEPVFAEPAFANAGPIVPLALTQAQATALRQMMLRCRNGEMRRQTDDWSDLDRVAEKLARGMAVARRRG